MKTMMFLVVLAVLAVGQTAVVPEPAVASRANLQVGVIQPGDRLLNRHYLQRYASPNAIQSQDYIYNGQRNTRISAVRAMEVGGTQYASARIIQGGVGWNNVTVRVQSARGRGYHYMMEVYGR